MLVDTHCHLNLPELSGRVEKTIQKAKQFGVNQFIVPGIDVSTSQTAVRLAQKYPSVYAAVGLHPSQAKHHPGGDSELLKELKPLIFQQKVVAVGEVGIDKHEKTSFELIEAQKKILRQQIKLALEFDKALILHNRLGTEEMLIVLEQNWDNKLAKRVVFHCCQAEEKLLTFALKHKIYLGVDGDLSWSRRKQRFIEKVPLDMLVLETDSPYLKPKPNSNWPKQLKYPESLTNERFNEPKNIAIIAKLVAIIKQEKAEKVADITTQNAHKLFNLDCYIAPYHPRGDV
jgi:TatD DNase family protein